MASQILEKAREYESKAAKQIKAEERPAFHLVPPAGWMNDPNGFSVYQGKYHLFFQYYPYASHWNDMHWGHAVSDDMLHWEYLPCALAPDCDYDSFGVFSGSAVTAEDGKQLLMYTAVRKEQTEGETHEFQTQAVAFGDGVNYEKVQQNPVIDSNELPEGASRIDFRDPKIVRDKDGSYTAYVANRAADTLGQILAFHSEDAVHWHFANVLVKNDGTFGKMWECPDFFELDGKHLLLVSPQDMEATRDLEYHCGNGTLCLIGEYDKANEVFHPEKDQSIDYGIDFYAPQTLLTEDGRRIMIGWMQNWDTCAIRQPDAPWMGQMTIPREIFLKDGRLYQKPSREVDALRGKKTEYKNVTVKDECVLEGINGRVADIEMTIRAKDAEDLFRRFELRFAQDDRYFTSVSYRPHEGTVKIDRKYSGTRRAVVHQRHCLVQPDTGDIKLRIILDRFSAEVFINDGEKAMTTTFYTGQEATGISFFCDGEAEMDVTKYELNI